LQLCVAQELAPTPAQLKPASTTHDALHPSPFTRFASSQASAPVSAPSPQVAVHKPPCGGHENPLSTNEQLLLQPLPPVVSPSSQASPPRTNPSPQIAVHAPPWVGQVKPPSTALQVALQPSPPAVSPSSQASLVVRVPSPQTSLGATTHWPARLQLESPAQEPQTMPSTTPQSRLAHGSLTPAGVQPAVKPVASKV
jgi:hypothetical protein